MNVLITGSAGFIGSHLARKHEERGDKVIGVDDFSHPCKSPWEGTRKLDVASSVYENELDSYVLWADVVFHLAAQIHVDKSIEDPTDTVRCNVQGTLNILELCRKHRRKLVFASSSEVYGSSQSEFMDENHPLDAQSPYAASKVAGDRLCKAYIDTYGMDICILRSFNTFGPLQNDGQDGASYGAVIGIFTRAALKGEPMLVFGSGEQRRDYMYISDALRAYDLAVCYTGVLNAGTGTTVSINELAEKVNALCGNKSMISHVDARPGEVQRLCAGIDRIRGLGFNPEVDFDNGLLSYIEWYKAQKGA